MKHKRSEVTKLQKGLAKRLKDSEGGFEEVLKLARQFQPDTRREQVHAPPIWEASKARSVTVR